MTNRNSDPLGFVAAWIDDGRIGTSSSITPAEISPAAEVTVSVDYIEFGVGKVRRLKAESR